MVDWEYLGLFSSLECDVGELNHPHRDIPDLETHKHGYGNIKCHIYRVIQKKKGNTLGR